MKLVLCPVQIVMNETKLTLYLDPSFLFVEKGQTHGSGPQRHTGLQSSMQSCSPLTGPLSGDFEINLARLLKRLSLLIVPVSQKTQAWSLDYPSLTNNRNPKVASLWHTAAVEWNDCPVAWRSARSLFKSPQVLRSACHRSSAAVDFALASAGQTFHVTLSIND